MSTGSPEELSPQIAERAQWLVANRGKVHAAKLILDQRPGLSLKGAKKLVDALPPAQPGDLAPLSPEQLELLGPAAAELRRLAIAGSKVQAVRLVIDRTGWSLKQAKDFVDPVWPGRRRGDGGGLFGLFQ